MLLLTRNVHDVQSQQLAGHVGKGHVKMNVHSLAFVVVLVRHPNGTNAQLGFLHIPLPLSTTSSGWTTMRRYEDHSPQDRNSTTSNDTIVTIPPLVVRIRASSTVFVKASSLVNRDLGAIANVQPETRLTRYQPTGLPVRIAQRNYPVKAQSLGRARRNKKQADGSLSLQLHR